MILGLGTDIVEVDRVRKVLSDPFMRKILSENEYEMAMRMNEEKRIRFVSGRFAAKEAIIKCLSDFELPEMKDLDIRNNEKGKPEISYKDYDILVSISHEIKFAAATALCQGKERR